MPAVTFEGNELGFTVFGNAAPAGSKRAFVNPKTGRAIVTDDSKGSKPWKAEVKAAAGEVMAGRPLLEGPLVVAFTFWRPRPLSHFTGSGDLNAAGRRTPAPTTKPDVLKLARAVEDALTGIVWRDDAQVVSEFIAKRYGEPARVEVVVAFLEGVGP